MSDNPVAALYRRYLNCLNRRDWGNLATYVADDVKHNGRPLGLSGYRAMLEKDCHDIPDLAFTVDMLVVEPPHLACRLAFDCTPSGRFLGIPVNGRRIQFYENAFYRFDKNRIVEVWSIVDKAVIEKQLADRP
ncbi:ester cyclase [Erwinia sp. 9145]|uniref:ester cyclase n=1 Tax=Erwinia sp. 9145 TaxID=1500895 RepID=UPI0005557472|nr:ester cyclase [Erwinia sp. 9145]